MLFVHALYVLIFTKVNGKEKRSFFFAVGASIVTFLPWLYAIVNNVGIVAKTTSWDAAKLPLKILDENRLFKFTAVFFDLDYVSLRYLLVVALVLVIVTLAIA